MAEIGVLELQIRDNAGHAGEGLNQLAGALSAVKKAVGKGLGLSTVANQVVSLSKTVNEALGTNTTVKNLSSLFNSISSFSKIKKINIDVDSLEKFKTAISGFSIGNAGTQMRSLQQALSGTWSTDGFAQATGIIVSAGNIFDSNGTASKLSTVTGALTKFTKAYKDLPNSTKKMENVLGNFAVTDFKAEYEAAAERAREAFEQSGRHGIAFNPQQFGGKGSGRRKSTLKAEQMQMDLDQTTAPLQENAERVESTIESTTRGIEDLNIRLHETKDTITSIVEAAAPTQSSSLSIIPFSGSGGTFEHWKEADTSINAADAAVQNLRDHLGDMNSYLENSTTYADRLAQSLGNMGKGGSIIPYGQKYYDDLMDKAKEYWEYNRDTAEDVMLSTRRSSEEYWKPDFTMEGGRQDWSHLRENAIEAEGSVSDTTVYSSIEEIMQETGMTAEQVREELQKTLDMVYGNASGNMTVFSSIEEVMKSTGMTAEQVRQELQKTLDMVYGVGSGSSASSGTDAKPIIDVDAFLKSYSHLDYLEQKYEHLKSKLGEKLAMGDIINKDTIDKDVQTLKKLETEIKKLKESEASPAPTASPIDIDKYIESYSHIDYLKEKLDELKSNLAGKVSMGVIDKGSIDKDVQTIKRLEDEIKKLTEAEEEARSVTARLKNAWSGFKSGIQKVFPTLNGMIKRLGSIAKYRALRAVLKHIADGFKEGFENLKGYKEAIGDDFATQIKEANAQLLTMKNSIGAAVAPAFQALLPILNSIVSAVITVINWVNQLISLLTGKSTWTKATEASAESLDNVKKSAGGAGQAVKDLLADWDELNIIQSESGGGGGGGGGSVAADYASMFEEMGTFDQQIKDIVNFIKENFETIKTLAEAIGIAILTWKISKAFGNTLNLLQTLSLTAGLVLSIDGIKVTAAAGYDIGENGINNANILSSIRGILETAVGGALIGIAFTKSAAGGAFGFTIGAMIALAILGYEIDQGQKDALYGDIHLEAEEIQEEINRLFEFNVDAMLNDANIDHNTIEKVRADLTTAIREANADYVTFKLRANPESAEDLAESVKQTVENAKDLLEEYQKRISIGFGFDITYDDPKLVQKFSTENITGLEGYITKLGNDIGKILEDGIVDGIKEQNLLDELMNKLNNVTRAVALGRASAEFATNIEKGNVGRDWTQVDRQGILEYAKQYNEAVEKVREAAYLNATDTKASLGGIYAGMLQREADNPGTYTEDELQNAKDAFESYNVNKVVEDFVNNAISEGKKIFLQNLSTALGGAMSKANFDTAVGAANMKNTNLMDWFQQNLGVNLGWGSYGDSTNKDFVKYLGLAESTGWDMLADDIKKRYIGSIIKKLGKSSDTYKRIADELKVPIDEILSISKADWDHMGDKERERFIQYIKNAYGEDNVTEAMKKAGYIGEQIEESVEDFYATPAGIPIEEATEGAKEYSAAVKEATESTEGYATAVEDTVNAVNKQSEPKLGWESIDKLQNRVDALKKKVYGDNGEEEIDISDLGINGPIIAEVQAELDENDLYNQAKEAIEAALSDGEIDTGEMFELQDSFGQDLYNQIVNELGIVESEIKGRNYNPATVTASAGVSDVGFSSYAPVATGAEEITVEDSNVEVEFNTEEMSTGVQSGTREGFANVVSALNALLTALNNKNFTVNVTPTSTLGYVGGLAAAALANRTGSGD